MVVKPIHVCFNVEIKVRNMLQAVCFVTECGCAAVSAGRRELNLIIIILQCYDCVC